MGGVAWWLCHVRPRALGICAGPAICLDLQEITDPGSYND